jgi:hypothetical protein
MQALVLASIFTGHTACTSVALGADHESSPLHHLFGLPSSCSRLRSWIDSYKSTQLEPEYHTAFLPAPSTVTAAGALSANLADKISMCIASSDVASALPQVTLTLGEGSSSATSWQERQGSLLSSRAVVQDRWNEGPHIGEASV